MFAALTNTQIEVLKHKAIGLSDSETADRMNISEDTAKTHIKNMKQRIGLQKATELVAYYWCNVFGTTLEEQRNSILKTLVCICFLYTLPIDHEDKRRVRIRLRRYDSETIIDYNFI